MIEFTCDCGRRLKAKEDNAGRTAKCTACGRPVVIPDLYDMVEPAPLTRAARVTRAIAPAVQTQPPPSRTTVRPQPPSPADADAPDASEREDRSWRDYAYALFIIALAPFWWALMVKLTGAKPTETTLLPRGSWLPCLIGLATLAAFLGLIVTLFPAAWAQRKALLTIAGLTATATLLFLLVDKYIAGVLRGLFIEAAGAFAFPHLVLRFLAGSYDEAVLHPDTNYWLVAFCFTVWIAVIEAAFVAIPLLWHFRVHGTLGWRGAMAWGLAAGAAVGAVESTCYTLTFDNPHLTAMALLLRFVTAVAFHATIAGSIGIFVYQQRKPIDQISNAFEYLNAVLGVTVVAILAHGQFDTLVKRGYAGLAMAVGLATIAILAAQVELMRKKELAPPA